MFLRAALAALATAVPAALLVGTIHAAPAAPGPGPAPGTATAVARPAAVTCPPPSCDPTGPIVAIGDSVTYGYGATTVAYSTPPTTSWPADLGRILGIPVVNAGVNGDTADSALHPGSPGFGHRPVALQLPALLALRPRLVIVGFGMAEAVYGRPVADAVAGLDALLRAVGDIPTVIVGSHVDCAGLSFCRSRASRYTTTWDTELRTLAARHHSGLVLDSEGGLAAAGEMADALHPNAAGYRVMAARIAAVVRDRLPAASGGAGSTGGPRGS